jgi:uncharacterized protein YdeI (YjbR/CyaY-like superfamily)
MAQNDKNLPPLPKELFDKFLEYPDVEDYWNTLPFDDKFNYIMGIEEAEDEKQRKIKVGQTILELLNAVDEIAENFDDDDSFDDDKYGSYTDPEY